MRSTFLRLLFVAFFYPLSFLMAQTADPKDDVMLQGFFWDSYQSGEIRAAGGLYNYLNARAANYAASGIDVIWTPPPSQGDGMAYFPRELFTFTNAHGTEAELKAMLATFKANNIHGMADVVANHRSGTTKWADFTNPAWGCEVMVEDDEVKGLAGQIQPCSGVKDEGEGFDGSRDLNHQSSVVIAGFKEYLDKLKTLGFDSWRWDFTKGFPGKYVGEYNASSLPYFSVGEYYDANITLLTNWINATGNTLTGTTTKSAAFDFSLYFILERAVNGDWWELNSNGSQPGLAGTYGFGDYAVTFAQNHDIDHIQGTDNIMKANAYILTHAGIPMLFLKHYRDHQQKINELIAVRKQNGLNAWSSVSVASSGSYYAAYIDDKVAVKIGPGGWTPAGTGWILNTSGTDYSVWSKIDVTFPEIDPIAPPTISMIGPAVGGWNTDVELSTTDGVYYTLADYSFSAGDLKFRANNAWTANWGAAAFPAGAGTQDGKNIPVTAGTYDVTFNITTGVYTFGDGFTIDMPSVGIIGTAVGGWTSDIDMLSTDGINYTLDNYTFTEGVVKFRLDNAWTFNWGSSSFPIGTGTQNGTDIPVTAGKYNVTFNANTGAYAFSQASGITERQPRNRLAGYPNPAKEKVTIVSGLEMNTIHVFDLLGGLRQSTAPRARQSEVDLTGLIPGLYLLVVRTNDTVDTVRIMKE